VLTLLDQVLEVAFTLLKHIRIAVLTDGQIENIDSTS
jgi:hypothetical protein